jgi:hypothetical protein
MKGAIGLTLLLGTWAGGQTPGPIMQSILPRYQVMKLNLVESAEVMPAEAYDFKLTPPQRSFAEWMEHNASMNYSMCASAAGQSAPPAKPPEKTKAALSAALRASFDYCDGVFESMTDEKSLQPVKVGDRTLYPVNVMIGLVANWNEHYGNIVGYLRSKGITPPSTARAQKGKK